MKTLSAFQPKWVHTERRRGAVRQRIQSGTFSELDNREKGPHRKDLTHLENSIHLHLLRVVSRDSTKSKQFLERITFRFCLRCHLHYVHVSDGGGRAGGSLHIISFKTNVCTIHVGSLKSCAEMEKVASSRTMATIILFAQKSRHVEAHSNSYLIIDVAGDSRLIQWKHNKTGRQMSVYKIHRKNKMPNIRPMQGGRRRWDDPLYIVECKQLDAIPIHVTLACDIHSRAHTHTHSAVAVTFSEASGRCCCRLRTFIAHINFT